MNETPQHLHLQDKNVARGFAVFTGWHERDNCYITHVTSLIIDIRNKQEITNAEDVPEEYIQNLEVSLMFNSNTDEEAKRIHAEMVRCYLLGLPGGFSSNPN